MMAVEDLETALSTHSLEDFETSLSLPEEDINTALSFIGALFVGSTASVSEYSIPPSEADVDYNGDHFFSNVSTVITATASEYSIPPSETDVDYNGDHFLSNVSTALTATASQYSLPESETSVEPPLSFYVGGVNVKDSGYCLSTLESYLPEEVDVGEGKLYRMQMMSEYEAVPSVTDVSMSDLQIHVLLQ